MFEKTRWTRAFTPAHLLAAVALLAGCDSTRPADDHADEVEAFRITIGASEVTLNRHDASVISGTVPVVIGTGTHAISVEFLDEDGVSLNSELQGDFELRVEPGNTSLITFARTGAFAGELTRVAAGTTTLAIILFHQSANHAEFSLPLPVVVQ